MKRFEGFPIFHGLSPAEVERVLVSSEELVFPAGYRIFDKGDACDGFYIITAGTVDIRRRESSGGAEVRVALLGKPSVFGEMSMIADRPRSAVKSSEFCAPSYPPAPA